MKMLELVELLEGLPEDSEIFVDVRGTSLITNEFGIDKVPSHLKLPFNAFVLTSVIPEKEEK